MERSRFITGGLLLLAAIALGATTPEVEPVTRSAETTRAAAQSAAAAPTAPTASLVPLAPEASPLLEPTTRPARATTTHSADEPLVVMEGEASWYSDALAGRRTASGEPYDPGELIAAHRALPFGTRLRVTNLANDRSVEVRVIDRGPFVAGRVLDLSRSAAQQIGMIRAGHARVRIEVLGYGG